MQMLRLPFRERALEAQVLLPMLYQDAYLMLLMLEPRASCILGQCSTTEGCVLILVIKYAVSLEQ